MNAYRRGRFFATHYHELTDLSSTLERLANLNVSVKEWEDNVVFLHKIVEGSADKSYGIHVAKLAGVPRSVNERATEILAQLEATHGGGEIVVSAPSNPLDAQLSLFGNQEHPLLDDIREVDLNNLTPLSIDAATAMAAISALSIFGRGAYSKTTVQTVQRVAQLIPAIHTKRDETLFEFSNRVIQSGSADSSIDWEASGQ